MRTDSTDRTLVARGLLRINEAAEYAAIGRTVAYRLIGRGEWPTVMIGRSRRVPVEDLEAWVRANKRTAPSPVPEMKPGEPPVAKPDGSRPASGTALRTDALDGAG